MGGSGPRTAYRDRLVGRVKGRVVMEAWRGRSAVQQCDALQGECKRRQAIGRT